MHTMLCNNEHKEERHKSKAKWNNIFKYMHRDSCLCRIKYLFLWTSNFLPERLQNKLSLVWCFCTHYVISRYTILSWFSYSTIYSWLQNKKHGAAGTLGQLLWFSFTKVKNKRLQSFKYKRKVYQLYVGFECYHSVIHSW